MIPFYSLPSFLLLGLVVFCLGVYAVLARRNLIAILVGIELMLNGASINFLAFNHFLPNDPAVGQIIVLFVIGLAAAEAAIALPIVVAVYRNRANIDVDQLTHLHS